MRKVLCDECGRRYPEEFTQKLLFPRSPEGEPAEYARIIKGVALCPTPSQRVIYVNNQPHPLESGHYDCDLCGYKINPGDRVTCLTVWTENQTIPSEWEFQYLIGGKK